MNVRTEIITIKPTDSETDTSSNSEAGVNQPKKPVSNLSDHPSHESVCDQIDEWMKKNENAATQEEELKNIQNALTWFFWLRRKKLVEMWARTTDQARAK
ncbi:MAG: hypothetical protein QG639_1015 [Patescibacteria group bacterium]|jgi:hypothetical protein|nr:hypothetical protein [Patescibacteria group bacterium]